MEKDAQLLIKINSEIKREFKKLCDDEDTTVSRELRRIIKKAVKNGKLPDV